MGYVKLSVERGRVEKVIVIKFKDHQGRWAGKSTVNGRYYDHRLPSREASGVRKR